MDRKSTQLELFSMGGGQEVWGKPKPKNVFKRWYVVCRWSAKMNGWLRCTSFGENGAKFELCGKHQAYAFAHKAQAELIAKHEGGKVEYYDVCVGVREDFRP